MTLKAWLKALRNSDNALLHLYHNEGSGVRFGGETFCDMHISQLDLGGMDFSNTEWEACILEGINFSGTKLGGSFFNGCTLHSCLFDESDLEDVSFEGCVMQRVVFRNLSYLSTEVTDCQLKECLWENVVLEDSVWSSTSLTGGRISSLSGSGKMSSVVLRDVLSEGLDTKSLELENCSVMGEGFVPEGFNARSGRRCKV